jgi:hypothetical protein
VENRYPTRAINTRTLEFETDQMLPRNSYAVLSHTWTQKGREVTYENARAVLADAKIAMIRSKVGRLERLLANPSKLNAEDRSRGNAELAGLKQKLKVLEANMVAEDAKKGTNNENNAPKNLQRTPTFRNGKGRVDLGTVKLIKAIEKANELGHTYIWIDSCCIDKPNNTELVESLSSMGDWY